MCVYIVHYHFTTRKKQNFLFPFGADNKLNYSSRLFTSCFPSVITVAAALTPPCESKKWTLSHQLGRTLPLPDKIRTRSERKIPTSLCIPVPALTFYFVRSSKDVSAASLIVSSFLLFAAFKKEDSGFDEVRKKTLYSFVGKPVTLLAQFGFSQCISATLNMHFFFFEFKIFIKVLTCRCIHDCRELDPHPLNPAVTQRIRCVIHLYTGHVGFSPSHLDRRPSGVSLHPRSNAAWEVSQHTNQAVPACGWQSHSVPTFGNVFLMWNVKEKKKKLGKFAQLCTTLFFFNFI